MISFLITVAVIFVCIGLGWLLGWRHLRRSKTVDDLETALTCDVSGIPTVEFTLHNYEIPMTRKDMDLIDEMVQHPERFILEPRFDRRGVPWCSAACPRYDRRHDLCRLADDGEVGDVCLPMVQQMSKNGSAIHRRCQVAESKLVSLRRWSKSTDSSRRDAATKGVEA